MVARLLGIPILRVYAVRSRLSTGIAGKLRVVGSMWAVARRGACEVYCRKVAEAATEKADTFPTPILVALKSSLQYNLLYWVAFGRYLIVRASSHAGPGLSSSSHANASWYRSVGDM